MHGLPRHRTLIFVIRNTGRLHWYGTLHPATARSVSLRLSCNKYRSQNNLSTLRHRTRQLQLQANVPAHLLQLNTIAV
ncbi:hypothetical protein CBOM_07847 [Ceraceosorus bombacis]|uniref:Uncharacterized protein n=1 Tax=Ceraceosorus bombacis TaxID=401625 RepID=A0A0N7LB20_9BASI|nr:hypothetical protein CBOM_07847 [Ceraceosorus bombacis]